MTPHPIFTRIRQVVAQIPPGKVATYGQIARLAGTKDARLIGWALKGNSDPEIPCHRVVRKDGSLAPNYSLGTWKEQKRRLRKDGVTFLAPQKVNLPTHLWKK